MTQEHDDAVLGIDLGTSSVKVVLADSSGHLLRTSTHEYPVLRPHPGWAEADPNHWWAAIVTGVAVVTAGIDSTRIRSIGLAGQMHGVVLVDAAGQVVRDAILWADARAELGAYRALPGPLLAGLSNPLSPGMEGPILAWLSAHEPSAMSRAQWAMQPKDWVRGRLTGVWATEPSDASATLLYDVIADDWSDAVLAALGLSRGLLPPMLAHSGVNAGPLRPEAARELGVPAGIAVSAGAGDTPAAALGSGLLQPGTTQLTIGTGVQIVSPVSPPAPSTLPAVDHIVTHLYRDATPHGWYAMAAGLTGGTTLAWVRNLFGIEWDALYAAAGHVARADDPLFLPHVMGERTPYLDTSMRGAWLELNTRHDREAMLYAALEGVAFAVADGLQAMPSAESRPEPVWLAGGGTKDPAWRALLASVLEVELLAVDVPNASARGAALLGSLAAGLLTHGELAQVTRPATKSAGSPRPNPILAARRHRYLSALATGRAATTSKGEPHAS